MTGSSSVSLMSSSLLPSWLLWVLLVLSGAGLADATYLTVEHYRGTVPPCSVSGCEMVLTSRWATVGGVPLSLAGGVFYSTVFLLTVAYWNSGRAALIHGLLALSGAAMAMTVWLLYLQAFVIGSFCMYCLFSAAVVTLLLAGSVYGHVRLRRVSAAGQAQEA